MRSIGITLDADSRFSSWDPIEHKPGTQRALQGMKGAHCLLLRQVLLGPEAKDDDTNVVEVEAMGQAGEINIPFAVMRGKDQASIELKLKFPDPPVTFHLAQGSGPVYLLGTDYHMTETSEGDDDDMSEAPEGDDDDKSEVPEGDDDDMSETPDGDDDDMSETPEGDDDDKDKDD